MATAGEIVDRLFCDMPKETAEDYDNVGLLAGKRDKTIKNVLLALDLNLDVIKEAKENGCEIIITHHPVMFRSRKRMTDEDYEGRMLIELIENGICHIAMHTNYDIADGGVSYTLAKTLGLDNIIQTESGICVGNINAMHLKDLASFVSEKLGGVVRAYGPEGKIINKVAVLGGSGGSYTDKAMETGADLYITGEISYHTALDAWNAGLAVFEAGHAATEYPAVFALKERIDGYGLDINTKVSKFRPFF